MLRVFISRASSSASSTVARLPGKPVLVNGVAFASPRTWHPPSHHKRADEKREKSAQNQHLARKKTPIMKETIRAIADPTRPIFTRDEVKKFR